MQKVVIQNGQRNGSLNEHAESPDGWNPYPVDSLPDTCRDYVRACAKSIGVDPAFLAVPMLPVLGGAIGNSVMVLAKSGWSEGACLWSALISQSGGKKTPSIGKVVAPTAAIDSERIERWKDQQKAIKATGNGGVQSPPKRAKIGDSTLEAAADRHSGNPRGLLLARDELSCFLGSFDKYNNSKSDRSGWIEMHDGKMPLTVDRKSETEPLCIRRPNISITGGIQPMILRAKLADEDFSSGLVARFLLAEPPTKPNVWTEAGIDPDVTSKYADTIRALYGIPFNDKDGPALLDLTAEAKELYVRFHDENGKEAHEAKGHIKAHLSKMAGTVLRFALILQLTDLAGTEPERLDHPAGIPDISGSVMVRAIDLGEWHKAESRRLYAEYRWNGFGTDRDLQHLRNLPDGYFNRDDVSREWGIKKRAANYAITRLLDRGFIEHAGNGEYSRAL